MAFFFLSIASILPNIIPYISDLILIILFSIFCRNKIAIFTLFLVILWPVTIFLINGNEYALRLLLAMTRPFIVMGIIFSMQSRLRAEAHYEYSQKYLCRFIIFSVILLSVVSFTYYLDQDLYRTINNAWNGPSRFLNHTDQTIASVASYQGRVSSLFVQPATCALVVVMLTSVLIFQSKMLGLNIFAKIVLLLLLQFIGWGTLSTVWKYGFLIICLSYIFFKFCPNYFRAPFFVLFMFLPTAIAYYLVITLLNAGDQTILDLLGGRFVEGSNVARNFLLMDGYGWLFGIADKVSAVDKISDGAILTRTLLYGAIYNTFFVFLNLFIIMRGLKVLDADRVTHFSIISFLGFAELGFTSFSQPGVVFFIYLPLLVEFLCQHQKRRLA